MSRNQHDWDSHLPYVMSAYRSTEHESTGYSPCRLFLGRENVFPLDIVLGDCQTNVNILHSFNDFVLETEKKLNQAYSDV